MSYLGTTSRSSFPFESCLAPLEVVGHEVSRLVVVGCVLGGKRGDGSIGFAPPLYSRFAASLALATGTLGSPPWAGLPTKGSQRQHPHRHPFQIPIWLVLGWSMLLWLS